jgi:hypothetical protein
LLPVLHACETLSTYKTEVKNLRALLGQGARDVTHMGEMHTGIWLETLKGRDYFEDLSKEKRVILELI